MFNISLGSDLVAPCKEASSSAQQGTTTLTSPFGEEIRWGKKHKTIRKSSQIIWITLFKASQMNNLTFTMVEIAVCVVWKGLICVVFQMQQAAVFYVKKLWSTHSTAHQKSFSDNSTICRRLLFQKSLTNLRICLKPVWLLVFDLFYAMLLHSQISAWWVFIITNWNEAKTRSVILKK